MNIAADARTLSLALTGRPSATGTAEEAAFVPWLQALLAADGLEVRVLPIPNDPLGRANIAALARGPGSAAVILSGHFDTVPVDDYVDLAPLATEPEALAIALVARLTTSGSHPTALAELADGSFLPGRGLLDMKSGVAAGLAVLRAHARNPERVGSILLLATADEEDRSVGMRAAAAALPALLAEWGLDARLGINLDATIDNGDGSIGRVVAFGCVGKHLLSALVVGREVHACYPWRGVNASHLAAHLICAIEGTPELTEGSGFQRAAPPTVLASADTKTVYNVTTPGRAWTVWNVLTQRRTADEVVAIARRLAAEAIVTARETACARCAALDDAPAPTTAWDRVEVLEYAELRRAAIAADPTFEARFAGRAGALARDNALDLPTRARILTELAWDASGREGPAVVLGFASLPYPATIFPDPALRTRLAAVAHATAARLGTTVAIADFLPVIVDMPFLGHIDTADLRRAASQSPLWGTSIDWDLDRPTPGVPMMNVGPWGRDYHHWLERVHVGYAFTVLPELLRDLAEAALQSE